MKSMSKGLLTCSLVVGMLSVTGRSAGAASTGGDADFALLLKHLMDRHNAGYPGGPSNVEKTFQDYLRRTKVPSAFLKSTARKIKVSPYQAVAPSIRALDVKKPATLSLIKKTFATQKTLARLDDVGSPTPTHPIPGARYSIRLLGVKSLRCADDQGIERGCDSEEPYVIWSCTGGDVLRFGRTEEGKHVRKGGEYLYKEDTVVFADDQSRPAAPPEPLIFVYKVIEKDDDTVSKEEALNALRVAAAAAASASKGDWDKAAVQAAESIVNGYEVIAGTMGGGDDRRFPAQIAIFDNGRLAQLTSGHAELPLDKPLFETQGSFPKLSNRLVTIGKDWKVLYQIARQ